MKIFPFSAIKSWWILDIHHRSVLIHLEGFLADLFHFQPIKFDGSWTFTIDMSNPFETFLNLFHFQPIKLSGSWTFTIDLFQSIWRAFLADLFHFQPIKSGGSWTFTTTFSFPIHLEGFLADLFLFLAQVSRSWTFTIDLFQSICRRLSYESFPFSAHKIRWVLDIHHRSVQSIWRAFLADLFHFQLYKIEWVLDIHHRLSNPLEGFLSRSFPFSAHKIWWVLDISPSIYPIHLGGLSVDLFPIFSP
ncbi:hypothetical protein AVEN_22885-1 [Araneus ventricosus]|uniref:Uncharacterized protein n=1 Tax=Araneus ventricosus TaxID=182803 RepID=A0A4Y2VJV7_ARAVE|nr:hypothetical protein AVEN_22885-1 [Araneus ventricosus]